LNIDTAHAIILVCCASRATVSTNEMKFDIMSKQYFLSVLPIVVLVPY